MSSSLTQRLAPVRESAFYRCICEELPGLFEPLPLAPACSAAFSNKQLEYTPVPGRTVGSDTAVQYIEAREEENPS